VSPFAPLIGVAIAFVVLLRVLIWKQRREGKNRRR